MQIEISSTIVSIMEIIGTIAFAASGAMVGIKRNMDIFGVCVLGIITAVGGGIIRDVILGITPPNVFLQPADVLVAALTSCVVFLALYIGRKWRPRHVKDIYEHVMLLMDTVGLGVFTVLGVNTGISCGYGSQMFLLVFVGTITGVGGGLLRDMMAGVPPMIFVKHIYACASILGAVTYVFLMNYFDPTNAMLLGLFVVILIRFLAAYYRWNLPRVNP